MENNLFFKLLKCQTGNEQASNEVIGKFEPLLKSQSQRLNSEDSFEDLQLFLLEFIKSDKINQLRNQNDFVVLSYLKKTVTNYATNLVKKEIRKVSEIPLSQFEFENGDNKISVKDHQNEYRTIENRLLLDALTDNEKNTVLLHYFYGYQIKEVADLYGVSQSAISQRKKKGLSKIKNNYKINM